VKKLLAGLLLTTGFLAAVPAHAMVRYDFTAFSSFDTNGEQITGGGFSFVTASFLADDTSIAPGDLLSCSVATTETPTGPCGNQDMLFHVLEGYETVSFGIQTPLNPATGIYYYFIDGAFGAAGTYESQIFAEDQAGRLVVTDLGGNWGAVPEPASWAMMIVGMGAVGFAMRGRRKVAVSFA
jgi:hypothetical protein